MTDKEKLAQTLWERAIPEPNSGCWLWTWGLSTRGYGRITIRRRTQFAHRVSWFAHRGSIPSGMYVCHSCDTPICINPDHLFLGTHQDNVNDRNTKGRARGARLQGEQNGRAKLSEADVRNILRDRRLQREIAAAYGVGLSTIAMIKARRKWTHINTEQSQ